MIFLILLLGGLLETEAMSVTGMGGTDVTIKCSHTNAFSNVKYFCKGACDEKDVLITSRTSKDTKTDKYHIADKGNTFNVTILHLTMQDSGTYWCGIERLGVDTYNEVVLTVIKESTQDPNNLLQLNTTNKLVYIGAGLGVVVLALAMVLLVFFRHRKRDIQASSGKNHDTVYSTVSRGKQDGHHTTTSSSTANEDQETDGRTTSILSSSTVQHQGDRSNNIYSNVSVSSASQIQPDGLLYTTVSFNKHTEASTDTPGTAELTYSTINHEATDKSAV
ncbi:uncharacterized protein LOC129096119 isoform X1 [Anoplopoma fimbria]|uniref:uncharacterized protein LOC129096119 isoform X1 n=1 Tax=Anoplopoma fimbria TaxID=229290 RepID=UPI0023EADF75|nr:uncharacterized protein LOC129096119 isoform X1 [Anoplopoma fimbria]